MVLSSRGQDNGNLSAAAAPQGLLRQNLHTSKHEACGVLALAHLISDLRRPRLRPALYYILSNACKGPVQNPLLPAPV